MSTEKAARTHGTKLVVRDDQEFWTREQLAALSHMGVVNAPNADLAVFHHVCQRTGLDPFVRQIYMISRRQKDGNGNWITKWTIQTGIDGYRLVGRRAADRRGESIGVDAPRWAHKDGGWRDLWAGDWGFPLASQVTIYRNGHAVTGTAVFDEYKQTRSGGALTNMWATRPAGMIAKCAEALAWRMAFPQDLAGVYVDAEMHQADNAPATQARVTLETLRRGPAPQGPGDEPATVEVVDDDTHADDPAARLAPMWAAITAAGITGRDEAREFVEQFLGRENESAAELADDDVAAVIAEAETITGGEADADRD